MKKKAIDITDETRMAEFSLEIREATDGKESRTIRGSAAVFNVETQLPWFKEKIDPGFFDPILDDSSREVVALYNHDKNMILARRSEGTLKLWKENDKLMYEFEAPETTVGNDLLINVRSKNIKGSSFTFSVSEETMQYHPTDYKQDLRTLLKIKEMRDLGPVTFPAYTETEAYNKRERPEQKEESNGFLVRSIDRDIDLMANEVEVENSNKSNK